MLGAWCEDRLTSFRPVAPRAPAIISKTSDSINDYFVRQRIEELGPDASDDPTTVSQPTPKVPTEVLAALDQLLEADSQVWPLRCEQAYDVLPSEWPPFQRLLDMARNPNRVNGRYAHDGCVRPSAVTCSEANYPSADRSRDGTARGSAF